MIRFPRIYSVGGFWTLYGQQGVSRTEEIQRIMGQHGGKRASWGERIKGAFGGKKEEPKQAEYGL